MSTDVPGPLGSDSNAGLGPLPEPAAWDYYHRRLMGAPGETRHHVVWTADYVGCDEDLKWLLDQYREGKRNVEAPIWVRALYYGDDVQRLILAERERWAADVCNALAMLRSGNAELAGRMLAELVGAQRTGISGAVGVRCMQS